MVNFAVPNITIPFDLLTNEQREAIYLIMTGDGFHNPLKEKITKAKAIVINEIGLVSNIQIHPYSQTLLTEQQIIDVSYHLNMIMFWLNALEIHSDKLSGTESEYVGDMMQRLSVAGLYTKTMKSITGMDNEQYSLIFGSLTSLGENIVNNLSKLTFCEGSSNFCEIDTNNSGVEGIAHAIEVFPSTVDSMNQCLFPKIIERLKNLIDADEENFCKARRIIERYSYGTKIISSLENDPIFGEAIKNVFATPELRHALTAIRDSQNTILESDEILKTDKFFPEFDIGGTLDCLVEDQLIHYGIKGQTGSIGGRGVTGSPGIPGPIGDCNCGASGSPGGGGAGGNCDCSQGGDAVGCCCVCDGYGVQATEFQCQHYGGTWYGAGSDCDLTPCNPPSVCTMDSNCALGFVCCGAFSHTDAFGNDIITGGQCIQECPINGGCPPCQPCAVGYSQCGTQCCQDSDPALGIVGHICCGDTCVDPCVHVDTGVHSCPDCQGECCPQFTTCCGGDGCCPDGSCCQGECCEGGTISTECGGNACSCCEQGSDFTSKCCNVAGGTECCGQDNSGVWETCCGLDGCCAPSKCCGDAGCCPDETVCCMDDFGVQECIPVGAQCNCPTGSYECDDLGIGEGLLCCNDGQTCCTKTDGSKYCCSGECCGDVCCEGTCFEDGVCCGVLTGHDYGFGDPICTNCQHPNSDVNMCFCLGSDGSILSEGNCFDLYGSLVPCTETAECTGDYTYGSDCYCPEGFVFDINTCECECTTNENTQPCESPWSAPGDANDNDPCWSVGGYCCDDNTPHCCGWNNGTANCHDIGSNGHQCCELSNSLTDGTPPPNIACGEDTGNWLCNNNDLCCGGWRYNPSVPLLGQEESWEVITDCCEEGEVCKKLPDAVLTTPAGDITVAKGYYSCCPSTGNLVDGGEFFACPPDEYDVNWDICSACPCGDKEAIGDDGTVHCCPEETDRVCVDSDGTVVCWNSDEFPDRECCTSQHSNINAIGENGCCDTYNNKERWISWNGGVPITKDAGASHTEFWDGCPCGCEETTMGGDVRHEAGLPLGESPCKVACSLVQAGVGIGNDLIDHRCGENDMKIPGHVCECREFDAEKDCPNTATGEYHNCCCRDDGTMDGLGETWVLYCRGDIEKHWNSCGDEKLPGEIWCYQCDELEDDDCMGCCYNAPGVMCGEMHRDAVPCNHECLGNVGGSNPGPYNCGGNDPGGIGQESGFCSYGCNNGMPTCFGIGNKPTLLGDLCTSSCNGCGDGFGDPAGAQGPYTPPNSGSCWFDNNCSSFASLDDGIRMNVGGVDRLIDTPYDMCKKLGGVWYNNKSCDDFVPKEIRDIANTNSNQLSLIEHKNKSFIQHGGGQLLKKYPNKTIDEIIGAKKKYTPVLDASGNVIETKIELVFDGGTVGGQSELSYTTQTNTTQTITNYPIQFQLINFIADEKIKTEARPDVGFGQVNLKDSKSKISKAELKNEKELGEPGAELTDAETIIVSGELTASISNEGTIGESLLISFVSGSNIKLSTNESNNIIRISVDDIYLNELIDVSDTEPSVGDVLQWIGNSGGTGTWTPVSPNVGVTGATGPLGGSDKQILFNQAGAASGSNNLKYDYSTNTLQINSSVEFGSGFTFSGTANIQNNPIVEPQLKDYTETVYSIGNVTGSSTTINVNNGNVQTLTKAIADGGIASFSFSNASTGSVTMNLIMTNAGTGDGCTFPTAIWAGGNVPSYSAIGTDIITFNTIDGGTSWYGFVGGLGFTG